MGEMSGKPRMAPRKLSDGIDFVRLVGVCATAGVVAKGIMATTVITTAITMDNIRTVFIFYSLLIFLCLKGWCEYNPIHILPVLPILLIGGISGANTQWFPFFFIF